MMTAENSTDKSQFDGVVAASGPGLEEEIKPFLNSNIPIVFVNFAICRVEVDREVFHIRERGWSKYLSDQMSALDWKRWINGVLWAPKPWNFDGSHKRMEKEDWPHFLVDHAFTIFSAIHLLICKDCKNIYGAGANLKPFADGRYSDMNRDGNYDFLFDDIRSKYAKFMKPDLERLNVTFTSTGLK